MSVQELVIPLAVCLGMFLNPDRDCLTKKQKAYGLEFRDKERCKQIERDLLVKVVTFDKQNKKRDFHHIQSNFNTTRNILKDILASFPDGSFRRILYMFLDYFHSPVFTQLLY